VDQLDEAHTACGSGQRRACRGIGQVRFGTILVIVPAVVQSHADSVAYAPSCRTPLGAAPSVLRCHARQVEAPDLFDLLSAFDDIAVDQWLDGGWGVDCLLGSQSRPHGDLDVVLAQTDLDRVRALLARRGFRVIRHWLPTSLALRDVQGREVDLHPVDRTEDGGGDPILLDIVTWHYAPPVEGSIDGRTIRCASVKGQLLTHQGYEPRSIDFLDVHRLAGRFGLTVPAHTSAHAAVAATAAEIVCGLVPPGLVVAFLILEYLG